MIMKRTIQFLTVAVLMGLSAGVSAQTAFRLPVSSTTEIVQKPIIGTTALKPLVPTTSPATESSCPPVLDPQTIVSSLRNSWAEHYQEILKARMAAYDACVSECIGHLDPASFPQDDPNDPKDFSYSLALAACQNACH
jgi:hypothetical protein